MEMNSPAPQAVVFDLGKVLLDFDYSRTARALAPLSDVGPEELRLALDQSPLLVRFETGEITAREMYAEVVRRSGFRGAYAQFAAAFADIFTEIPAMIALHTDLRERGVPTYIFSNTNEVAVDHIWRNYPFFRTFTGHVYSHQARCMKPQSMIYDAVEQLSGRRGAELLYIDDRADNIAAGAARQWQVVHHVSVPATVATVRTAFRLPALSA